MTATDYAKATPLRRTLLAFRLKRAAVFEAARAAEAAASRHTGEARTDLMRVSNRLETCAATFSARAEQIADETRLVLSHSRACRKEAVCMLCARAKARRTVAAYAEDVREIQDRHPQAPFIMATFTLPNRPLDEMTAMLADLERAYSKMMRLKRLKDALLGHVAAQEIAIRHDAQGATQAGGHLHALWVMRETYFREDTGLYIDQSELTQLWTRSAGAPPRAKYIVDIRRVRNRHGGTGPDAAFAALREVLKYQTKPASVVRMTPHGLVADPDVIAAILKATYRRRMIRASGIFLAVRKARSKIGEGLL